MEKNKPIKPSVIEEITQVGDDGVWRAKLNIGDHGAAADVFGNSLDECINRAVLIRDAINKAES